MADGLIAPVPTSVGIHVISDQAGHHSRALGNWQSDNADDFKAPPGTPVLAVEDGTVQKVNLKRQGQHGGNVFGAQVTINGASGGAFYTHIEGVTLKQGQTVHQGDVIGYVTRWDDHPEDSHVHVGMEQPGLADSLAGAQQIDPGAGVAAGLPMPASPRFDVPDRTAPTAPTGTQPLTGVGGTVQATQTLPDVASQLPAAPPTAGPPSLDLPGSVDLSAPHREVADSWQLVSQVFGDPDAQRWAQNALLGTGG